MGLGLEPHHSPGPMGPLQCLKPVFYRHAQNESLIPSNYSPFQRQFVPSLCESATVQRTSSGTGTTPRRGNARCSSTRAARAMTTTSSRSSTARPSVKMPCVGLFGPLGLTTRIFQPNQSVFKGRHIRTNSGTLSPVRMGSAARPISIATSMGTSGDAVRLKV